MKTKSKIMAGISYIYILLPFIIFMLGWVKLCISIPLTIILLFCLLKVFKDSPSFWMPSWDKDTIIKVLFIIGIIAIWVYYSGVGKQVFQNSDHIQRNAVFNILVEYKWPIKNYKIVGKNMTTANATSLIYYIGFWLPAALVGKKFGLLAGYYAQWIWAFLGILLVYYFICAIREKVVLWPLLILLFFSGLDIIGIFLTGTNIGDLTPRWHIEWWCGAYQYSSMTTQLFWVFNQAIPAWLCTMLAYVQKTNQNIVFILACSMLSSTFPFVGLLLLCLFWCFTRQYDLHNIPKTQKRKRYFQFLIKDTCTFQNVVGGGCIGILSFLYLIGNRSGNLILSESVCPNSMKNSLSKYMLFIIIEIGIYVILLYKDNQHNKLFYFVVVCLCIIPPIKVGYSSDFCMRASIPALFILMLIVIDTLEKSWKRKGYGIFVGLIIGSVTPLMEFRRTVSETFSRIDSGVQIEEIDDEPVHILNSLNFAGDIDNSIFFKYFVK